MDLKSKKNTSKDKDVHLRHRRKDCPIDIFFCHVSQAREDEHAHDDHQHEQTQLFVAVERAEKGEIEGGLFVLAPHSPRLRETISFKDASGERGRKSKRSQSSRINSKNTLI